MVSPFGRILESSPARPHPELPVVSGRTDPTHEQCRPASHSGDEQASRRSIRADRTDPAAATIALRMLSGRARAGREPRPALGSARDNTHTHITLKRSQLGAFRDLRMGRPGAHSVGVSPKVRQSSFSEARQLPWQGAVHMVLAIADRPK